MEKDIKILETMLKIRKEQKEIIELANGYCENCNDDIRALESGIKALKERQQDKDKIKELEEENKNKKEQIDYLRRSCERKEESIIELELETNTIPTSVIKEIRNKAKVMDYYTLSDVIKDLNRALGDDIDG